MYAIRSYYAGAGEDFHGSDAVHHHMTNTRITDPEVIEFRYPVRILRTMIRKNSGGKGRHHGGNGMIREYEFREAVNLSLLTQRRNSGPYGMKGGAPGEKGMQYIVITSYSIHYTKLYDSPLPGIMLFPTA